MPKDLMQQSRALKEIDHDDPNDVAFELVTIFVCFLCDTFTSPPFFSEQHHNASQPPKAHLRFSGGKKNMNFFSGESSLA